MQFNPQMMLQMMMRQNPRMMEQFNKFQQLITTDPKIQQQYQQFKQQATASPEAQQKIINEAMAKINGNMSI